MIAVSEGWRGRRDEGAGRMDRKEERGLKGKQSSRKVGLERAGGFEMEGGP